MKISENWSRPIPSIGLGRQTTTTLYSYACTVVRTDTGLSESFEVKVGLHHGSVLSPLLFADDLVLIIIIIYNICIAPYNTIL